MRSMGRVLGMGLLMGLLAMTGSMAQEKAVKPQAISKEAEEFFETKVRPVLFANCFSCHGDKQQLGGLRLDSRAYMVKGGGKGPAFTAGEPEKSLLIQALHYDGALKMPPVGKLKDADIAALNAWVKMGAPWPTSEKGKMLGASHWSFQPVKLPALPKVKNTAWVQSPIDRFLLAKLEAKGLQPNPPADRRTLIRRAYFDLTGLPPTQEETAAFIADKSPDAFAKVVDRLLASPSYGERWGRHWLDVARYADTKGYVFTEDAVYHNAYTYRDYVIRAFNEDLPYDQFLIQQLAADRLPLGEDKRPLAALGFLTVGRRFLNDPVLIGDDRIDVTSRGLMGLTTACARCHDHKFDPISQKDYYALYGVFASSHEKELPISPKAITEPFETHNKQVTEAEGKLQNLLRAQVQRLRSMVEATPNTLPADVKKTLQAIRPEVLPSERELGVLAPSFETEPRRAIQQLGNTITELRKTQPATPEFGMGLEDNSSPFDAYVFIRGNPGNRGENVPRRFLTVLSGSDPKPFTQGGGRLELAQSIASKQNPLTSRVLVNRVWMYHFGAALVRTPGDFGTRGELPTHPELLDWLASTLTSDSVGWSLKKLHRLIMLSSAYQQGSQQNPLAFLKDPENRLFWKQNRQRLDLEALRDSLLFVSGKLDTKIGGPAVELTTAPYTTRRTVYGFIDRQNLQGIYRTFDFASPDTSSAQRFGTTVPQQALFMMNSPFVVEQARSLAQRKEIASAKANAQKIRAVYQLLFGRAPTQDEADLGLAFLQHSSAPVTRAVWQYGYGGIDEAIGRVTGFTSLPHWSGSQWQGGPAVPDPKLHYLLLNGVGGHVGIDAQHAAIRRWVSPMDGVVSITATLAHGSPEGDGVQGRIVSSRLGILGQWTAFNNRVETSLSRVAVQQGDTLDFVVDCRANHNFDAFEWMPTIKALPKSGAVTTANAQEKRWDASAEFRGPQPTGNQLPTAWEKYLHALLMTNEFCFVD